MLREAVERFLSICALWNCHQYTYRYLIVRDSIRSELEGKLDMANCPLHWTGAACDWPICVHGRANPATKLCQCYNYYSPPFCISCLPGYWGESCDRQPLKGVSSANDFPIRIPPFLVKPILLAIGVVLLLLMAFVIYRIRIFVRNRKPPRYDDIAKDLPPPYTT
uniref:EGF-like domain-containing protein n=1 Tax=Caenorhabditis japonica TaxID=281687 RepID=A0A8R1EIL6_CAEJA